MAVSFEEYLRRGAQDPALRGEQTEDLRSALQAISSYQRNVDVGRALGIESTGQMEGGVLRRFMNVLERPALGLRAGALKAIGYDDPRLARYDNPLEAAAAGLRGDVRLTGGDIFRTERDDNPLERAAKLAGAFTFDVATDPITYVGTPAALGRKTASELAFRSGASSLDTAIQATAKATGRSADQTSAQLTKKLFERSDVGRLVAREDPQIVAYIEDIADQAGRAAVGAGADLSDDAVKAAYDRAGRDAVGAWVRQIAGDEFGNALGMSLYAGGRRGMRSDLAEFLGSREAAEEVFAALPDRVKGGLYFVNPITGQQIARFSSGTGQALGPVADWANKMRTYTAAIAGRGTQYISGTRGRAWQKVREAARESYKSPRARERGRVSGFRTLHEYENTIKGFVREKEITRQASNVASRPVKQARYVTGEVAAFRPKDPKEAEAFEEALRRAYYQPMDDVADGAVVNLAQDIRAVIDNAREEAIRAGINVPSASETGYIPLVFSERGVRAYRAQREAAGVLRRSRAGGAVTDPTQSRSFGQIVVDSAETATELGFDFGDDVIRLNPREANFRMFARQLEDLAAGDEKSLLRVRSYLESLDGELPDVLPEQKIRSLYGGRGASIDMDSLELRMFEEDPVKLMAGYTSSMASRIESAELIRLGQRYGILTRGQADFRAEIAGSAAEFVGALKTVNSTVYNAVRANPRLARLVDPQSGIMSEAELSSLGIIQGSRMNDLIANLQVNQVVPDSQQAVKEFEDLTMQWFRLSALRDSGRRLQAQEAARLDQLTQQLGQVNSMLSDADDAFRALDATQTRLATQYGLTVEEAQELTRTVSEALDTVGLGTQRRLPPVVRGLGDALLESGENLAKASDERITEIAQSFFDTRQIASAADQEAAYLGLQFVGAGEDVVGAVNVPQAFRSIRARAGVKNLLEARARVAANPDELTKFWNDVYDPLFQVWKSGATSLRGPGYTFLNMMGNLWHNFLGDVPVSAHKASSGMLASIRQAYSEASSEVVEAGGQRLTQLEARAALGARADRKLAAKYTENVAHNKTLFQIFQDFVDAGGVDSSQLKEALDTAGVGGAATTPRQLRAGRYGTGPITETRGARVARSVADTVLNNRVSGAVNSINTDVETWTRFAAYLDTFVETGSIDAAMDRVFLLHFNYGDLSNVDLALRRIFPFYVWSRNNIPAQARALFMQPGKIRRLMSAQEALKGQLLADEEDSWLQEVLPDYIAEVEGFATRIKSGPHNVAIASKLPFDDVDRIFQLGGSFGIKLNTRELASMLGPQVVLPLQALTQRDFRTGGRFDPLGREATGWRTPLGYLPGIGRVGPGGERRISESFDAMITDLIPFIGTTERALSGASAAAELAGGGPNVVSRALEAPTPEYMRERAMSNLLNVTGVSPLFGFSATTLAPRTISSALRERRVRQQADINQAAGRAGVSAAWIRERLNEGLTPEQIAMLIQQGEGRIADYEAELAERSQGPSERTQGLLRRLTE